MNNSTLEEMVLYEISLKGKNDPTLNSKVYGSHKGHCLNNICKFKNLRCKNNFNI